MANGQKWLGNGFLALMVPIALMLVTGFIAWGGLKTDVKYLQADVTKVEKQAKVYENTQAEQSAQLAGIKAQIEAMKENIQELKSGQKEILRLLQDGRSVNSLRRNYGD